MKYIKNLSVLMMAGVLSACGGSSDTPKTPDLCEDYNLSNCYPASSSQGASSSSSGNETPANDLLPFHEKFTATNGDAFFTANYKALLTQSAADPSNAFYYPTAGLDSGRLAVGDGKLSFGNARFTIGQRYETQGTHIDPNNLPDDYRINTTTSGTIEGFPTTTTWGDLDLSKAWKMSFCVVEATSNASSNDEFQLYIDNNTTGAANSIHGNSSRLVHTTVRDLTAGKRVEITVPGQIRVGGVLVNVIGSNPGTSSSFLQLRVPGNGVLTVSDLWMGYQSDTTTEPAADTCVAGSRVPSYGIQVPPTVTEAATLSPNDGQLTVNIPSVARVTSIKVAYNTSDSLEGATVVDLTEEQVEARRVVLSGLTNGTTYYVFYQAANNGGESEWSPSVSGVPEVPSTPPATPSDLVVYPDSGRALVTWAEVDGAMSYKLAINTVNSPDGAQIIDDIENTHYRVKDLVNGTTYYFFISATNTVGDSEYSASVTALPQVSTYIYEANFAVTKEQFFGTEGVPAVQTIAPDSEQSIHVISGGGSNIVMEENGIRLPGARFLIGQRVDAEGNFGLTSASTLEGGTLDLSTNYRVSITVASAPADGNFQVYVDNNTTSNSNSIHGAAGRIINLPASEIADGQVITVDLVDENHVGTANSFIQIRTDNATGPEGVVVSAIRIESLGGTPNPGSSSSSSSVSSSSSSSSSVSSSSSSSSSVPVVVDTRTWGFDSAVYADAGTALFSAAYDAAGTNNIRQLASPAMFDGLYFFNSSTSAVMRYREAGNSSNNEGVAVWNTNGSFFSNNTTIVPDVGQPTPTNVRAYIGVPVEPGVAVTITVSFRQTGDGATAAKVALVSDGTASEILAAEDASYAAAGDSSGSSVSAYLPAGHTHSEVRILYGREGLTTGGVNITSIERVLD